MRLLSSCAAGVLTSSGDSSMMHLEIGYGIKKLGDVVLQYETRSKED
jgi:hypothetical protein